MQNLLQTLWFETWWTCPHSAKAPRSFQDVACHYFNLVEAATWFVFAALVACRWAKFHRSTIEIAYAVAFLLFGLSDIIESWFLTSWLLWWKSVNLVLLLRLRQIVIRQFYPENRLF